MKSVRLQIIKPSLLKNYGTGTGEFVRAGVAHIEPSHESGAPYLAALRQMWAIARERDPLLLFVPR